MKLEPAPLAGLWIIHPAVFTDERGHFFETYHKIAFSEAGINQEFVQDNHSVSNKNVLRGLHFQCPPHAQGKLVRVVKGKAFDVAVDLRSNSPTFGKHFGIELSAENKKAFFIPAGFAHGFLALEEDTHFTYKCSAFYQKSAERTLMWNDPALNISWPVNNPVVSAKDREGLPLAEVKGIF